MTERGFTRDCIACMKTVFLVLLLSSVELLASPDQTNAPAAPRDPTLPTLRTNPSLSVTTSNQLEQLRDLTPEERRRKVEEFRAMHAAKGTNPPASNPTQQDRVARLRAVVAEMRRKNEAGSLTPTEQRHLVSLERTLKRLDEQNDKAILNAPTNAP